MPLRQRHLRFCAWKIDVDSSRQGVAFNFKARYCNLVLDRRSLPSKPLLTIRTALSGPIRVLSRLPKCQHSYGLSSSELVGDAENDY